MFVKRKSFQRGETVEEGRRGRARKQPECNLEMEGKRLDSLRILCARWGWEDNGWGWFLHCKCAIPQQRSAASGSRLKQCCLAFISPPHSPHRPAGIDSQSVIPQSLNHKQLPSHSSATSLLREICSDSSIRRYYIPRLVWHSQHNFVYIRLLFSPWSSDNPWEVDFAITPRQPTLTFGYDKTSSDTGVCEKELLQDGVKQSSIRPLYKFN